MDAKRERAVARQLWHDGGWVLASPTGQPLNPNTDYHEWKRLLQDVGLTDAMHARGKAHGRHGPAHPAPAHADRHVLDGLVQRVDGEPAPARDDAVRTEVASQAGGLIWRAGRQLLLETSELTQRRARRARSVTRELTTAHVS